MAGTPTISSMEPSVDPNPAYRAALGGAAVFRRRERRLLAVQGISSGGMLKGILSGRIPAPLGGVEEGWAAGDAPYSAILTPKGKMVTDLRVIPDQGGGFLLDLPLAGLAGALAHFKKYLNPRFAQLTDRTGEEGMLTLAGPESLGLASKVLGLNLQDPGPGRVRFRPAGPGCGFFLLGSSEVHAPVSDLLLPLGLLHEALGGLQEAGAHVMDEPTWEILRIETGTPRFGVDMTEETIPVEAGIHHGAIDYGKGCFTGQEVIIRLRDRGQVNKHLRTILLGEAEVPEAGVELFPPGTWQGPPSGVGASRPGPRGVGGGRKVGWVTSACRSPRYGQTIALAYVRRAIPPGGEVRLAGPDGPLGIVAEPG